MDPITGPLADALRRNRQIFNAKFAAATKAETPIDAAEFHRHLAHTLDPIVRSVSTEFAERTDLLVDALYDLSLDLFRQGLLGPKARYAPVADAWQSLLPRIPKLLAREPARVAGSITNALYNLARTPGTRPKDWLTNDFSLCQSVGEFLDYGLILAWRCGMPQYRQSALEKAKSLNPRLAANALGLPANTTPERLTDTVRVLATNPWVFPQNALRNAKRQLQIVATAGAFRGFTGPFLTPPTIASIAGDMVATDGTATWKLHADIYNSMLLRCDATAAKPAADLARIEPDGTLHWQGLERTFPELVRATSIASTGDTVVITISTSHHLFLVGLA